MSDPGKRSALFHWPSLHAALARLGHELEAALEQVPT